MSKARTDIILSLWDIIYIHNKVVKIYNNKFYGIRDEDSLIYLHNEYKGKFTQIDRIIFLFDSILTNRIFVGCNKKTAFALLIVSMKLNKYHVSIKDKEFISNYINNTISLGKEDRYKYWRVLIHILNSSSDVV